MSIGDLSPSEFRRLVLDPVLFVKSVLNATPDDWQGDILSTYIDRPLIAARSGTGIGKDALLAFITFHFLYGGYLAPKFRGMPAATDDPPKVIHTSTDENQLTLVLWTEMQLWLDRSNGLKDILRWTPTKIEHREHPKTWYAALQTSARRKDAGGGIHVGGSQGQHRENLLIALDEAAHIDEPFWAAYLGTLSQAHNRLLAFGNPDRLSGMFYRIYHDKKVMPLWKRYTISCRPHPLADYVSARGAAGPNQKILVDTWGIKHPTVQSKVFGVHPTSSLPNTAYSWEEMQRARVQGRIIPTENDPVQIGIDVARFGDAESIYFIRRGRKFRMIVKRKQAVDEIVDQILELCEDEADPTAPEWGYTPTFVIDETGVGGGVVDGARRKARERGMRVRIHGVTFGGTPRHPEKFANLAAEMWLEDVKNYFRCVHCDRYYEAHLDGVTEEGVIVPASSLCPDYQPGCEIPDDDELTNQAISREYKIVKPVATTKTRAKVSRRALLSKEEIRDKGGVSPDRMDGFCLACVRPRQSRAY